MGSYSIQFRDSSFDNCNVIIFTLTSDTFLHTFGATAYILCLLPRCFLAAFSLLLAEQAKLCFFFTREILSGQTARHRAQMIEIVIGIAEEVRRKKETKEGGGEENNLLL